MRILGYKRIIEYIFNMNNEQEVYTKTNLPFEYYNYDEEKGKYQTFESINLNSENNSATSKKSLFGNDNNNDNKCFKINCIGFTFSFLFIASICIVAVYFANSD